MKPFLRMLLGAAALVIAPVSMSAAQTPFDLSQGASAVGDPLEEDLGPAPQLGTRAARVVNGFNAPEGAYNFVANVFFAVEPSGAAMCGGALIAPDWILTAAHCVRDWDAKSRSLKPTRTPEKFVVFLGAVRRGEGTTRHLARVVPHPNYSTGGRLRNDIALLKLDAPMPSSFPIVGLPPKEAQAGSRVRIVGWGTTSWKGKSSDLLQEASTKLVSRRTCAQAYNHPQLKAYGPIDETRICADLQADHGLVDSCQGDSGGPLLMEAKGRWMAQGVVSFGYKCAHKGFYGVYTNVSAYLPWIERISGVRPMEVVADVPVQQTPPAEAPKPVAQTPQPPAQAPEAPKPAQPVIAAPGPVQQAPNPPVAVAQPTAVEELFELLSNRGVTIEPVGHGWTAGDAPTIQAGSLMTFRVSSDVEGELVVIDIGKESDVQQIFPNERTRALQQRGARLETRVTPGRTFILPDRRSQGFTVAAPAASTERWIAALVVTDANALRAATRTRGLSMIEDDGDYLRDVVSAARCEQPGVKCAGGVLRIRVSQ